MGILLVTVYRVVRVAYHLKAFLQLSDSLIRKLHFEEMVEAIILFLELNGKQTGVTLHSQTIPEISLCVYSYKYILTQLHQIEIPIEITP